MTNSDIKDPATCPDLPVKDFELLAPVGDWAVLEAALKAGADAVYLGLRTLNARRRAKNFSPDEFHKAVELIHARGAKAYLTLNIDLAQRELGQAARILELARQCHADAVLVRDPALLALRPHYGKGDRSNLCAAPFGPFRQIGPVPFSTPELQFHFSTQTCMANSADVAAAGKLGANRVVLAREMSLAEITAASAVTGVETEVFVQGALCFSVSGRCLLASWTGGRSGNRGTCTSPCRVPWTEGGKGDRSNLCEAPGTDRRLVGPFRQIGPVPFSAPFPTTPLSMKDLCLIDRLPELRRAGVAALKIEGRLKNAQWVSRAVGLYKRALAGEETGTLLIEVEQLGDYTGREMTSAYLNGLRDDLTGQAEGRQSTVEIEKQEAETLSEQAPLLPADESESDEPTYDLQLMIEPKAIACVCTCGSREEKWTIPKTVIRRPEKAIAVGSLLEQLEGGNLQGFDLGVGETNDPEFLLTPRAVNALIDRISKTIRLAKKSPDELVHIELPPAVSDLLIPAKPSEANCLSLGNNPDRVRMDAKTAAAFLRRIRPAGAIVDGLSGNTLHQVRAICENVSLIVALPQVFFEDEIPKIKSLIRACADEGLTVEVNSWGGWRLAKAAKAVMEAGPGMAVLNSLAAQVLAEKGMKCVTLSPEADRRQLEELTSHCPTPCSLTVFGRPPLLTTRVQIPERFVGQVLTDRRNVQIIPRREHGLYMFRPVRPFDLRGCVNERIRVKHLVVDLVGSDDPVSDWQNAPLPDDEVFHFNYDRTLT
jgi:U32 family peptidase